MELNIDLTNAGIDKNAIIAGRKHAAEAFDSLWNGALDFTGWVNDPNGIDDASMAELTVTARDIQHKCDYFLVLGVGGSFMGAKAVIDLLSHDNAKTKVIFAGYNFSARYIRETAELIRDKDVCLCVISKSGTTAETLTAYGIFKDMMLEKYGREETAARTYVLTEHKSNPLFDEAISEGYTVFDLPQDIGGRYSVLTPVGLLPVAVAGVDIREMMNGARSLADAEAFRGDALDYAVARRFLYERGKNVEVFEFFDPYFAFFGEWLKQLFGESEGKDGKGLFPASLMFSRDLHSMGQFLQQGTQCLFETFITVDETLDDVSIPLSAARPFSGKTVEQINKCAEQGVKDAHAAAGIPMISIHIPKLDARHVGEMLYWFEVECAVSALLSGVDPFDQPGVEAYKKEMREHITRLDGE